MRLTGDAATGASIIAVGMFFLWGAELIDVYGDDAIPSDFFPRAISILLILAGAALAAGGVVAARRVTPTSQDWRDFGRVTLPLAALTVGYAVLWRQIGYLGASMIVAPRWPTAGMYSFSYQSMSIWSTARSPLTLALKRSGNIVGEWLPHTTRS